MKKKIRYAVVGQGYFAQKAVLPAFAHARGSELAALVSGDEKKRLALSRKYKVPIAIPYEDYDSLLESGAIDAVYIALPNHLHREFALRAAERGVHVLCEKPMAVDSRECEGMIRAAKKCGVKLMIAYRLHFEAANLKAIELIESGRIGEPRFFHSAFSMQVTEDNIRAGEIARGGGPLYDIGIYCINAARYLFRAEPVEAFATSTHRGDPEVEQSREIFSVSLRFPKDRFANFVCGYGASDTGGYEIVGDKGSIELENAYEYVGEKSLYLKTGEKKRTIRFAKSDQVAPELVYFTECILKNREPEPSGMEGLADIRVIEAILKSARSGRVVPIDYAGLGTRHPSPKQKIRRPPVSPEPGLIRAEEPGK
jgi:predicted dehydrogenase